MCRVLLLLLVARYLLLERGQGQALCLLHLHKGQQRAGSVLLLLLLLSVLLVPPLLLLLLLLLYSWWQCLLLLLLLLYMSKALCLHPYPTLQSPG
jgi:hypothetical protein